MARQARFDCVAGVRVEGVSTPAWPSQGLAELSDGPWFSWRLLGRNNREIGRSPRVYQQLGRCQQAIQEVCERAEELAPVLSTDPRTGRWTWRLELDGMPAAVSARTYFRQREGNHAIHLFRSWLTEAASGPSRCVTVCRRPA